MRGHSSQKKQSEQRYRAQEIGKCKQNLHAGAGVRLERVQRAFSCRLVVHTIRCTLESESLKTDT